MEEDKLHKLFKDYDPELSSDFYFMDRLKNNLESVEIVKNKNAELHTARRHALMIAGLAGFVAGFVCCMFLPVLGEMVKDLFMGAGWRQETVAENSIVISVVFVSVIAVVMSLCTYDISLAVIRRPGRRG